MRKHYTPRPDSAAAKAVDHFDRNPHSELSAEDLASIIGVPVKNVSGSLASAVHAGLIAAARKGSRCYYTKGHGVPLDPAAAAPAADAPRGVLQPGEFTCCLYNDGELFLAGAQITSEGVLLDATQTAELREYLLHTGSLIEQLQQRAVAGVAQGLPA